MTETLTTERHTCEAPRSAVIPASGLHVLVASGDATTRQARERQLVSAGHRVSVARTAFEAIVKASCQVPDVILLDASLSGIKASQVAEFLLASPLTSHAQIIRLSSGRPVSRRVLAEMGRQTNI